MKQLLRFFSLGLLTAGIILLGVFYFAGNSRTNAEDIPTKEMIKQVEKEGYHVLSESEYIEMSVKSDEADNKEQKGNNHDDNKKNSNKDNDNKIKTYTLKIESGDSPSDISETLEDNNIISNSEDFTDFLEDKNYSENIQLGKFELSSDMGKKEMAETLTD